MILRVLEAGLQSQIVDFGRPSTRSLGVPVGGAADRWSLALGNALVGNPPDAPALEVTLAGPTLVADADVAAVVFGAPFDISSDRQPLVTGKTFTLRARETLRIRGTPHGARAYLCVPGGFATSEILGSRSALSPLRSGGELACSPSQLPARFLAEPADSIPFASVAQTLRVLPGAQADWFDLGEFVAQTFRVMPASDRMGLRLEGNPINRPDRELVSEPVCPGTVQVTNDGQCIVLGVDGQAIGGYPKIAHVIRADLDYLGQLRPGVELRFAPVSLSEAEHSFMIRQAELDRWLTRIQIGIDCSSMRSTPSL